MHMFTLKYRFVVVMSVAAAWLLIGQSAFATTISVGDSSFEGTYSVGAYW